MLLILVLNMLGYYGVFIGLRYSNDVAMTKALDADKYDERLAITIKVPVSIPYMTDQSTFTRVEGKFEHKGELYRIIKQRYAKDTLTVLCIKDTQHAKIGRALADYVKTFSDQAAENKSLKVSVNFLKDYLPVKFSICSLSQGWAETVTPNTTCKTFTQSFVPFITQPPETA